VSQQLIIASSQLKQALIAL